MRALMQRAHWDNGRAAVEAEKGFWKRLQEATERKRQRHFEGVAIGRSSYHGGGRRGGTECYPCFFCQRQAHLTNIASGARVSQSSELVV